MSTVLRVGALLLSLASCGVFGSERQDLAEPRHTHLDRRGHRETFGRCREHTPERRALFGELHVHTRYSLDANLQGNRASPDDAYRFARGEAIEVGPLDESGRPTRTAQIDRPLDFAAVTDHAEFMGFVGACADPDSNAYDRRGCKMFRGGGSWAFGLLNMQTAQRGRRLNRHMACGTNGVDCDEYYRDLWIDTRNAAERNLDRTSACRFTTFVGYEYTANPFTGVLGNVANMHRNVIFRNGIVPDRPVDYFHTQDLRVFWERLDEECLSSDDGCDVLVIPHNSNLSSGLMFAETPPGSSDPYTPRDDARRSELERLFEIYQHKGASECLPGASSSDELCDFEITPYNNLRSAKTDSPDELSERDFVRDAFGRGMVRQRTSGMNPFAYGLIASTDNHLGLAGQVHEALFLGGGGAGESGGGPLPDRIYFGPGGLTGVWAEENAREAIFRALEAKETFATSGPRIPVRLFGGWDDFEGWCHGDATERARTGYDRGVPMGGTLPERPEGVAHPTFVSSAVHDPGTDAHPGAPLQHLEIVKGWLDEHDVLQVTTHLLAGDRERGALNPHDCAVGTQGSHSMCARWEDQDFDPTRPAFYYVRAVEVPTCRWTTRVCVEEGFDCSSDSPTPIDTACCDRRLGLHAPRCFGVRCEAGSDDPCCAQDVVQPAIRERAWSSPIWYTPPDWVTGELQQAATP